MSQRKQRQALLEIGFIPQKYSRFQKCALSTIIKQCHESCALIWIFRETRCIFGTKQMKSKTKKNPLTRGSFLQITMNKRSFAVLFIKLEPISIQISLIQIGSQLYRC